VSTRDRGKGKKTKKRKGKKEAKRGKLGEKLVLGGGGKANEHIEKKRVETWFI